MVSGHKVTEDEAYVCGPWSDELRDALLRCRPKRMELVGDWSDLSVFEDLVDQVESLKLAGDLKSGKIRAVRALHVFPALKRLTLASAPKDGVDPAGLAQLESLDVVWQPDVIQLLTMPTLETVILRNVPESDLRALPNNSSITYLWLAKPAVESLQGIKAFNGLRHLRITDARQLKTLDGVEGSALAELEVENARSLADCSALSACADMARLRLLSIAPETQLGLLNDLRSIESVHVGGKDAPAVDWPAIIALPRVKQLFAMWDPLAHPEADLRAAVSSGREIVKFDALGVRGRRSLFVAISG